MDSPRKSNNSAARAFTLIELLVVLAIATILVAAAEPSYHLFLSQTGAQDAGTVYVQMLRRAQALSEAVRDDSPWGVCVATSSILLYKGSSCASRDSSYDEPYAATVPFSISGLTDVSFAKVSGLPAASGTTTIAAYGAQPVTIIINAKGTISY